MNAAPSGASPQKASSSELLSGVRKLPGISSDALTDEHKAVLLVVIGYRHKGGVSKTRIGEILGLEAAPYLEDLCKKELVYTAPGKELNWWRPTPEALLALGLRSYSDIPELKELERWFDSQKSFGNDDEKEANLEPIFEKAKTSQARRRRRELERRASVPRDQELGGLCRIPSEQPENSPPPPRPKGCFQSRKSIKSAIFCPPHPDSSPVGYFYALSCKNACRINSGVRRIGSSFWTLQPREGVMHGLFP